MTLDLTKPAMTRDGREVELLTTKGRGAYPIVGYILYCEFPSCWKLCGRNSEHTEGDWDLVNVPEPPRVMDFWMNVYPLSISGVHRSKEFAEANKDGERLACIHIRYTEGKGAEIIND